MWSRLLSSDMACFVVVLGTYLYTALSCHVLGSAVTPPRGVCVWPGVIPCTPSTPTLRRDHPGVCKVSRLQAGKGLMMQSLGLHRQRQGSLVTLTVALQRWFNAGPTSETFGHRWTSHTCRHTVVTGIHWFWEYLSSQSQSLIAYIVNKSGGTNHLAACHAESIADTLHCEQKRW